MKIALKEQFKQNKDKLKLLMLTWNANLIHRPKRRNWEYSPDSITIPWATFSRFLMELREEFKSISGVQEETIVKTINTLDL
jgi:hypothetical protein